MKRFSPSWIQSKPTAITLAYVVFAMLWITLSDWLLQQVEDTHLYAQLSSLKGLVFVAITAILLFLLLKGHRQPSSQDASFSVPVPRHKLLLVFLSLTLIAPLIGFGIIKVHGPKLQRQAYEALSAINDLKTEQLVTWMARRHQQADALAGSTVFSHHIESLLQQDATPARMQLKEILSSISTLSEYTDLALISPEMAPVVPLADATALPSALLSVVKHARQTRQAQHYTQYDIDPAIVAQYWAIPIILDTASNQNPPPILLLKLDLGSDLSPLLSQWPMLTASGKLSLLRRAGDSVIPLTAPSAKSNPLPISIDAPRHPGAVAVRTAMPGSMEGIDSQGKAVLAAYQPVADSGWYLVATLEREEVLAPLWELVFWVSLVTLAATLALAVMVAMLWRESMRAHQFQLQAKTDEQDRLLRKFYDLPFVGMAITSPETKQSIHCNDRLCEILGYDRKELQEISWVELTHPDDLQADLAQFEQLISGQIKSYSLDKRILRKDGAIGHISLDIKGIYRKNGTLEYLMTIIDDITERKQLEQSLQRRESEYRQLFMDNPLPMWVQQRLSGRFLAVNHAAIETYGYSREEFLSMGIADLQPAPLPQPANGTSRLIAAKLFHHQIHSGERIEVELHSHPIEFSSQQAEQVLAKNVTATRKSEANQRLAATVFDNTREGILITDTDTRIIKANRALCDMFGYREEELLGQKASIFKSGRHDNAFFQAMWQTLLETGHWQGEIWSQRKNGEIFPELNSISVVRDQAGDITHYVGIIADISRLKASEAELDFLAHHDSLTRLPNRRLLFSRLHDALTRAQRNGHRLALLMLDLDRFKDVNDSFGHLAGDELLKQVAIRLASLPRASDMLARLGGDEFVILLEYLADPEDAAHLADRIIQELHHHVTLSNGVELRTGASIGISLYPEHGQTPEQLLQQADAALYHAKEQGRGRFSYYTDEFTTAARQRLDLEARLRKACLDNQLQVYYQAQVDIRSGNIIGAEALLRWHDPQHGFIPPAEFIPVAEHTGLIDSLGRWVLQETCRQGKTWLDAGLEPLVLSVNLSPAQLRYGDIATTIEQVLQETGYPAPYLALELTESALMLREQDVQHILQRLRALGLRLAIDDFGTGYSSLAYLKHFPLDVLKIDKSFVDDIQTNADAREIAATIVAMGHTLGLSVLAEGVETQLQADLLKTLGCDAYQGYLTSRPLPPEAFRDVLATRTTS